MTCLGHRQGHRVLLPRITMALDLRQLADLGGGIYGCVDVEQILVEHIIETVHGLWPCARSIVINHWHIGPHASHGPEAPPPGTVLVEVCATLLPAEAEPSAVYAH
ncbi:MAG TPA: hypothetical protein VJ829_03765 [Candidatus Binatia bacterium]|jgi:hypothetical protein|nr:hypothetical protein [Candidatus Binatia bacterium]